MGSKPVPTVEVGSNTSPVFNVGYKKSVPVVKVGNKNSVPVVKVGSKPVIGS